jgi:butyrate kinase
MCAELALLHAWWRAANCLSVGQIYLLDNPLLRKPLAVEHVKPRLLAGLLLWLLQPGRLGLAELADGPEHASGLLGLAGTGDTRELLLRDDDEARLALEVYAHRLRAHVAAMTAALGGLDALVFTGGVRAREDLEIAAQVRATRGAP